MITNEIYPLRQMPKQQMNKSHLTMYINKRCTRVICNIDMTHLLQYLGMTHQYLDSYILVNGMLNDGLASWCDSHIVVILF